METKKIFSIAFITFFIIVNISVAGTEEYCADKWPNDYRMQSHCIEQQSEANHHLFEIAEDLGLVKDGNFSVGLNNGDREAIVYRCMEKWAEILFDTYDFRMVVHCIKEQFSAYKKISAEEEKNTGTRGYCADKWPDDYRMRQHCEKEQIKAHRELFVLAKKEGLVKDNSFSPNSNGSKREKNIYRCMKKWEEPSFNTYNYRMVIHCIKSK
jgi:hypothetical protein